MRLGQFNSLLGKRRGGDEHGSIHVRNHARNDVDVCIGVAGLDLKTDAPAVAFGDEVSGFVPPYVCLLLGPISVSTKLNRQRGKRLVAM